MIQVQRVQIGHQRHAYYFRERTLIYESNCELGRKLHQVDRVSMMEKYCSSIAYAVKYKGKDDQLGV